MVKMIAETDQTNLKIVPHLLVNQDSFSVTIVIVFFQCIFVIAMMIVEMALTKGIAKIFNVMVNNSNVRAITKLLDFASQLNVNVILKWIVPMAKTN